MDNKNIEKLMENLKGKIQPSEEQLDKIKNLAENYSGKSDDEILFEIIKLNKKMTEEMSPEEYQDKLRKLEMIRPLLNEDQRNKLDKVLAILKQE